LLLLAATAVLVVGAAMGGWWWAQQRRPAAPQRRPSVPDGKGLPTDWNLQPRPVFSSDERRVYRQLREALPHHIVLSKLPLVRFCQPTDAQQVRYWYELLGTAHVTFAVCSANGRVLAAIDLDTERAASRRVSQIKQQVMQALRVRYLRCPVDHMPTVAELQLLVPHAVAASRGPQAAPSLPPAQGTVARSGPMVDRRRERAALWQDSGFFQDSFFVPDTGRDAGSEFGSLGAPLSRFGETQKDVAGTVIDAPGFASHNTARP
jgi:hypothetical protein